MFFLSSEYGFPFVMMTLHSQSQTQETSNPTSLPASSYLFLTILEAEKSKTKVLVNLALREGLQVDLFLLWEGDLRSFCITFFTFKPMIF
jgi:hypothetical protein